MPVRVPRDTPLPERYFVDDFGRIETNGLDVNGYPTYRFGEILDKF